MKQEISLYFHIPFCTKKCAYCHFYVIPEKDTHKAQLMEGLQLEWERVRPLIADKRIKTIYFGGGTPSLMGPNAIQTILGWIYSHFEEAEEVTLEANPENITEELMAAYRQVGINRVSIGIQTLDNQLLKVLGRLHTAGKAIAAVQQTAQAGIENITIDLMYDLPNQTLSMWENTLNQAIDLPITHLSLYNLTIEPHTLFFKQRESLHKVLPDEATSLEMYEMATQRLASKFKQYEISAFAKEGFQSKHNTGYWTGRPFWGFGPSAFSYFNGHRFRNIASLSKYRKLLKENNSPIDFDEKLDPNASQRELLAINLRLIEGVHIPSFEALYGPIEKKVLEKLTALGFLIHQKDRLLLTRKGILFYDIVAAEVI